MRGQKRLIRVERIQGCVNIMKKMNSFDEVKKKIFLLSLTFLFFFFFTTVQPKQIQNAAQVRKLLNFAVKTQGGLDRVEYKDDMQKR